MGLLSWLFGGDKKTPSIVKSNGGTTFSSYAVGHSHYQDALKRMFRERTSESQEKLVEAVLVPDDGNPYDNQAVRVDIQGQTVGYLKHENARQFRKKIMETGHSGIKATCAAKIVYWEREFDNYLVILDLPLDYHYQASDPAPSKVTYEKETSGSEVFIFEIFNIERDAISACQINARVKLWMPPDDADKIFLYCGNWRLGFIAGKYFNLVASHLSGKLPYEAKITELASSTCRVKCKLISQEEAAILQKLERQQFEVEMATKYTPKKGFEFSIELAKRHKLKEGQLLFLDMEPIENCAERPGEFGLKFVDEQNNVVAHKRWEKEKIQRILRARNSGYKLVITIKSMEHPDKFDLKYIEYIRATAKVDFQK